MTARIRFHANALTQLDELDTWWRANRPTVPTQVTDEVERVVMMLKASPNLGTPYHHPVVPGVRVVRLRKTPYRLYYVHDQDEDQLVVLAVWSGMRGHGPPMSTP